MEAQMAPQEQPELESSLGPDKYTKGERKSAWGPTVLIVGMIALYFFVTRPAPALEGWNASYDEALATAVTTNQNLLVAFYMNGCPPCVVMNRTVLSTDRVKKALEGFVPVRVDAVADAKLANRFQVIGTPAYIVVRPNGEPIAKCEGYRSVDQFVAFLAEAASTPSLAASAESLPGLDDL